MAHQKIAIIICWYGPYPWYFPLFVHSCRYNPSIDFFIVTDNLKSIPYKPSNVNVVSKSLLEVQTIATERLGFPTKISFPYKLCDFKPAYGFLFPEIVDGYDFWGHGDIDVVYGDIRSFMTDEILNNNDIISTRHDYITGTFCLFRNNDQFNTLFMQSKDYKKVLSSEEHCCFDECSFLCKQLENGASIYDFPHHIQSMTYVVRKAQDENRLRAYFDFIIIEGSPGKIKWEKGKIIYKDQFEAMFYHLIKFKTECKRKQLPDPIPDSIYFTPKTIRTRPSEIPLLQTA